jgi:hypothetical protein
MTYREEFHNSIDWKKKVLIVELLHLLMLSKDKKWKMKNTAKYFNISLATVSENLKLSKMLKLGIVDACNSRDKAIKLLRKL